MCVGLARGGTVHDKYVLSIYETVLHMQTVGFSICDVEDAVD